MIIDDYKTVFVVTNRAVLRYAARLFFVNRII